MNSPEICAIFTTTQIGLGGIGRNNMSRDYEHHEPSRGKSGKKVHKQGGSQKFEHKAEKNQRLAFKKKRSSERSEEDEYLCSYFNH